MVTEERGLGFASMEEMEEEGVEEGKREEISQAILQSKC